MPDDYDAPADPPDLCPECGQRLDGQAGQVAMTAARSEGFFLGVMFTVAVGLFAFLWMSMHAP